MKAKSKIRKITSVNQIKSNVYISDNEVHATSTTKHIGLSKCRYKSLNSATTNDLE